MFSFRWMLDAARVICLYVCHVCLGAYVFLCCRTFAFGKLFSNRRHTHDTINENCVSRLSHKTSNPLLPCLSICSKTKFSFSQISENERIKMMTNLNRMMYKRESLHQIHVVKHSVSALVHLLFHFTF